MSTHMPLKPASVMRFANVRASSVVTKARRRDLLPQLQYARRIHNDVAVGEFFVAGVNLKYTSRMG